MRDEKIFIWKWMFSIFRGLVYLILGAVGFVISDMEMGIFFSLLGVCVFAWYIDFVPHSFAFDSDKITAIYVFKSRTVQCANIKTLEKQWSGIRNYPWGDYYYVTVSKPTYLEFKIPATKKVDLQIRKYLD